ncbi:alkene reductase [Dongia sedimenti]|uniref:Alkene reductase n=1 Tax=Dongia sedimenti TaxID=3064282 RepID=A0ABU0YGS7_9PROT|nr:alkene reductase [Rhodospirillaceae bacterium R-7]
MPTLFDPIQLGAIHAPNRILMAPLTRGRGTRDHVPTPLMGEYYAQRASAGLIISEATGISRQGLGWAYAPGLWTEAQVEGWKPVVGALHKAGGRIFAQLWHMGRIVHSSFLGGEQPVSASATTAPGEARTYDGKLPFDEARPLTLEEIPGVIEDYRKAARNALAAGFDGVQLHAANGYLIDQFLRDGTNKRTDAYGGPIENRIRLLKEATRALVEVAGADRTAVRLSPNDDPQGCGDSNSEKLFLAAVEALNGFNLAFLEMRASRPESTFRPGTRDLVPQIRKAYRGTLIINSDYHLEDASAALASGRADAIAFGRTFLANPDLPARLKANAKLNEANPNTFYTQGPEGYTDYPTLDRAAAAQ